MPEPGSGPDCLAAREQLHSQTGLHWFCQAITSPYVFLTAIKQPMQTLPVAISEGRGAGPFPAGRGPACASDTVLTPVRTWLCPGAVWLPPKLRLLQDI